MVLSTASANEGLYRNLVERLPVGVMVWALDDDGRELRLLSANSVALNTVGLDFEKQRGQTMREAFPYVGAARVQMYCELVRSGDTCDLGEVVDPKGRIFSAAAVAVPPRAVAVVFEDVSARKRSDAARAEAEAKLRSTERVFRTLVENSADAFTLVDAGRHPLFVSASITRLLGYSPEQFMALVPGELVHPDDRGVLLELRARLADQSGPITTEFRVRHRDGSYRDMEVVVVNRLDDPELKGMISNFRDVSDRKRIQLALRRSEEMLLQSQRLESLGRLAGGVAHDFNNLLTVVLSYCSLLLADESTNADAHDAIGEIQQAGQRAAALTQQLLAFGRQQILEPKVVDLNEVVIQLDKMIARIIGEDIRVVSQPSPGLWKVEVDPGQIEQAIINLVINARDAMPDGGRLTIETANVELDAEYARTRPAVAPGPHVMLAVTDSGIGMEKELQARIFEPFFSTKAKGKGSGLGLATVLGIVQQSGGHIWVYSEPGTGSTFKLYFPRTERVPDAPRSFAPSVAPRGNETILVAEDEPAVRTLIRTLLGRQGYQVIEADGPDQALDLSASFAGKIQLLLTDVVMPGMNGRALAQLIAARRPGLKVLYMSGYTDNTVVDHGVLEAGMHFLQKPITPHTLAKKVREVLDVSVVEPMPE